MTNSENFDLTGWKITLPVDADGRESGKAYEVKDLKGFEDKNSFFKSSDGAMVFRLQTDGATTSGSNYARSELREMENGKIHNWDLDEGGTMTATLKVDEMPKFHNGEDGRIIVGQIHGQDDELVRIYYQDESLYFANEHAVPDGDEVEFDLLNSKGQSPDVDLGEVFSYSIVAKGSTLEIKAFADGQEYISKTPIHKFWQTDDFYFKAGLYSGINEKNGYGEAQVSFYGLDLSHTSGEGWDGWRVKGLQTKPPVVDKPTEEKPTEEPAAEKPSEEPANEKPTDTPVIIPDKFTDIFFDKGNNAFTEDGIDGKKYRGTDDGDTINGTSKSDNIKGYQGNDSINGGGGNDYIEGNDGDDIIIGGGGIDTLKGSNDTDVFAYNDIAHGGDIILDFNIEQNDRIDVRNILSDAKGFAAASAFADGYIQLSESNGNLNVYIDMDGYEGAAQRQTLATLFKINASYINEGSFLLPDNSNGSEFTADVDDIKNSTVREITGSDKSELLTGGSNNDSIKGRGGNDTLKGGAGEDYLEGNENADFLFGGKGADILKGGDGLDTFVYEDTNDKGDIIIDFKPTEGEKLHIASIFEASVGFAKADIFEKGFVSLQQVGDDLDVFVDVDGSDGTKPKELLVRLEGVDKKDISTDNFIVDSKDSGMQSGNTGTRAKNEVRGDDGDDVLNGTDIHNNIKAREGDDKITGGRSADYIEGNDGNDTIIGGEGEDVLKGGKGSDTFIYEKVTDFGDSIIDYSLEDVLDISAVSDDFLFTEQTGAESLLANGYIIIEESGEDQFSIYMDRDGFEVLDNPVLVAELDVFPDVNEENIVIVA